MITLNCGYTLRVKVVCSYNNNCYNLANELAGVYSKHTNYWEFHISGSVQALVIADKLDLTNQEIRH